MKFLVLGLVLLAAFTVFANEIDDDEKHWQEFKVKFGKAFLSKNTEAKRRNAFRKHRARITELQAAAEAGEISYTPKMYHFHDLEEDEIAARLFGLKASEDDLKNTDVEIIKPTSRQSPPDQYDSRAMGYIGAPRDQGQCGSCWTFSTMSAIEGSIAVTTGTQLDLAEQQLVDCAKLGATDGDVDGCEGGWMPNAFTYLANNGGATNETKYPYSGMFGKCSSKPSAITVDKFYQINNDDDSIKNAVMQYGSLAIAVDATEWNSYGSGIFKAKKLRDLNHAVNLIGWGPDHWLIRNSWGKTWGENGTIRVSKLPRGTYYKQYTYGVVARKVIQKN